MLALAPVNSGVRRLVSCWIQCIKPNLRRLPSNYGTVSQARSSTSVTPPTIFTPLSNPVRHAIFGSLQGATERWSRLKRNSILLPIYTGAASVSCFRFLLLRGDLLKEYRWPMIYCLAASLRKRKASGLDMIPPNLTKNILDSVEGLLDKFTPCLKPMFLPAGFADLLGTRTNRCLK